MKIVKAMKRIARIKGEIKELKKRISTCLSTISENEFEEDFTSLNVMLTNKVNEVILLKAAVMKANVTGNKFRTVLELGELKSKMDFLKELDPKIGIHQNRYSESKTAYKSQITVTQRNQMLEECQTQINNLTDDLDEFNAKTDIGD
jgi:hypothetical protein